MLLSLLFEQRMPISPMLLINFLELYRKGLDKHAGGSLQVPTSCFQWACNELHQLKSIISCTSCALFPALETSFLFLTLILSLHPLPSFSLLDNRFVFLRWMTWVFLWRECVVNEIFLLREEREASFSPRFVLKQQVFFSMYYLNVMIQLIF